VSSPIERHRRLRTLFEEAVLVEDSARDAYLDRVCADDPDLRSHVIRLLAIHQSNAFLEQPALVSPGRDDARFAGTERFHVLGTLGAGGMGVVYEVHDRRRDDVVALKTLRRTGAADLYRLKREFRTLADVTHPNLVCLYELFVDEDRSFFTMERVRGVTFVEYVRGATGERDSRERLLSAFGQLVNGVSALHARGKLHRDIKPSNVLVTPDGRVVILDFGLIAEATRLMPGGASGAGTPAYMSPEEAAGEPYSEAGDWYAVGVTLYEALTGQLPFTGSVSEVLLGKRTSDPPPPADVAPGVAADLNAVCVALLHRAPERRMTGRDALRALMRDGASSLPEPVTTADAVFVGRDQQLQALNDARTIVANGTARTVAVYGPSGIGKSTLVSRFLHQFTDRNEVVVLTGRCYENESVPYKALDGVVDDLSRYLNSIPTAQAAAALPADVSALPRVFPVLLQVEAIARASRDIASEPLDPLHVRRRAFESLAAVFARLAAQRFLVVWIDDLQWADADSMILLEEILGGTAAPAMLTLLTFRSEEVAAKPFLATLLDRDGQRGWSAVPVEPMADAEADALIAGLLPPDATSEDDRRRMMREALGSPFVLEQLALSKGVTFDTRIDALAPEVRLFLETLAICGRPMAPEIVCDACDIADERQALVVRLRASRLIRSSGSSDRVEMYHDRIREVLARRLPSDGLRDVHRRIVTTLVARRSDDCEALFEHYRGAGDLEQASQQASLSAEKASAALAFDRAAFFYRQALDLAPSAERVHAWREGLAAALANGSRPAEAAEEYLRAAEGATHTRRVELQRRAAEQFLTGGHIDEGLDLIRRVLASVGVSFAPSPRMAAIRLVWRRLRIRWRGLGFVPRTADAIDADTLLRIDTCWAAGAGLALVDVISACDFLALHLHMALDAGEPSRIARGIALESAASSADRTFRKSALRLADASAALAQRVGTPQALATDLLADSVRAVAVGQWRRGLSSSEQSLAILRDQCVGVTWEINMAQNMLIWALMYLGEYGEVSRRVPALLDDARRRGNLYLATEICTRSNLAWLVADQPDEGEREATETMARWSQKGFHRQHYSLRLARVQTALYRGDPSSAWRLLVEQEAELRASMLLHVQAFRIEASYLRARCAIAVAHANRSERRFLAVARSSARRIARERMAWSDPLALLLEAGIASVEGRQADAERQLQEAGERFERAEMKMYAAVTRRRLGALRGGAPGQRLREDAEAWMATQSIRNPVAITRMLAPGFPDAP
jgi:serine/threonine protein kinase